MPDLFQLPGVRKNVRRRFCVAADPHHLRVVFVARDQDHVAGGGLPLHNGVDLFYKRAGHVAAGDLFFGDKRAYLPRHPVRAHHKRITGRRVVRRFHNAYAPAAQLLNKARVMDQRAQRTHARALLQQILHGFYGPVHAEAEPGRFCKCDLRFSQSFKLQTQNSDLRRKAANTFHDLVQR